MLGFTQRDAEAKRAKEMAAGRGAVVAAGPACCPFPVLTREGDAPLVPWSRAGEAPWSRRTGSRAGGGDAAAWGDDMHDGCLHA